MNPTDNSTKACDAMTSGSQFMLTTLYEVCLDVDCFEVFYYEGVSINLLRFFNICSEWPLEEQVMDPNFGKWSYSGCTALKRDRRPWVCVDLLKGI